VRGVAAVGLRCAVTDPRGEAVQEALPAVTCSVPVMPSTSLLVRPSAARRRAPRWDGRGSAGLRPARPPARLHGFDGGDGNLRRRLDSELHRSRFGDGGVGRIQQSARRYSSLASFGTTNLGTTNCLLELAGSVRLTGVEGGGYGRAALRAVIDSSTSRASAWV